MTITQESPALGRDRIVSVPPPESRARLRSNGPLVLLDLLQSYVAETADLLPRAAPGLTERSYELLELTDELEIWAIHWPQGQGLELHDHGGSVGAPGWSRESSKSTTSVPSRPWAAGPSCPVGARPSARTTSTTW